MNLKYLHINTYQHLHLHLHLNLHLHLYLSISSINLFLPVLGACLHQRPAIAKYALVVDNLVPEPSLNVANHQQDVLR